VLPHDAKGVRYFFSNEFNRHDKSAILSIFDSDNSGEFLFRVLILQWNIPGSWPVSLSDVILRYWHKTVHVVFQYICTVKVYKGTVVLLN
jgi:hypothetical protein